MTRREQWKPYKMSRLSVKTAKLMNLQKAAAGKKIMWFYKKKMLKI